MAPDKYNKRQIDVEALRGFGVTIVRYISDTAIDPHTYFEKQFAGELQAADSEEQIHEHIIRMLGWLEALEFSPQQYSHLDQRPRAASLPALATVKKALGIV